MEIWDAVYGKIYISIQSNKSFDPDREDIPHMTSMCIVCCIIIILYAYIYCYINCTFSRLLVFLWDSFTGLVLLSSSIRSTHNSKCANH